MFSKKNKTGFSLIEVNIAILIAAGGMLSLFALFPLGLRQSTMSEADMHQAAFASSFFEAIAANVKEIDDVDDWNDINIFWDTAVDGTGIPDALLTPAAVKTKVAEATGELIEGGLNTEAEKLRFVSREEDQLDINFQGRKLKLPPQMLIRVRTIYNSRPDLNKSALLPNSYAVSLISTHESTPAIYSHNTVYSMEFYFRRRP